jgi:hypothetical protein
MQLAKEPMLELLMLKMDIQYGSERFQTIQDLLFIKKVNGLSQDLNGMI